MKEKKAYSISILFVSGVLIASIILISAKTISDTGLIMNYDKVTEAKTIEIRNALLYLNTVEEGKRIINLPKSFKVYLEKENITVECNVPFYCLGGLRHTRNIFPINEKIIYPAELKSKKKCISKKISNCQNNITICMPDEDCCCFESLKDTLCTSSNPY